MEITKPDKLMTPHEKAELLRLIEKLPTTTKCTDCIHFRMGFCAHWKDTIPSDWLEKGCDVWHFNHLSPPF